MSKPVVYEHFGGKEGLYAVVVDREVRRLLDMITGALTGGHPRELLEQAALALLDYIEANADGFRILVRDSPVGSSTGTFAVDDLATSPSQVEHLLSREFEQRGFDATLRADVLADARRHGRADRPVVARRPQPRRRRRSPRTWSTCVERPVRPRGATRA